MFSAGFSLINAANNLGSVGDRLFGVESALNFITIDFTYVFTGHTLNEEFSVLVDENVRLSLRRVHSSLERVKHRVRLHSTPHELVQHI